CLFITLFYNNFLNCYRDWQAIKDALSSWIASFHSTVHPSAEMLSEGWLRLHLQKTMQVLGKKEKEKISLLFFCEVKNLRAISHM
ncbi:hypothetical protein B296_00044426, partial [Ensete ventricosum]